jgi:hypothetical protein
MAVENSVMIAKDKSVLMMMEFDCFYDCKGTIKFAKKIGESVLFISTPLPAGRQASGVIKK